MHDTEHASPPRVSLTSLSPAQVADMKAPEVKDALTRALGAAFQHLTITRQQARPHVYAMTVDDFAGCTRQAAYRIAKTTPSDPARALAGQDRLTNLHHATASELLPALAHVLGADYGRPVMLKAAGLDLPGILPLYWPTAAVLAYIVTTPAPADHDSLNVMRTQWSQVQQPRARLTAAALALAALQALLPVAWLVEINISRGTGEARVATEPMTAAHEDAVTKRAADLVGHSVDPDKAPCEPRDTAGHQVPPVCARCPWLGRCWPEHPPATQA